jgi:membrane protein
MAEEIKNILEPGGTEIDTAAGGARRYRKPLKSFRWCDIKSILSDSFSEWSRHKAPRLGASLAFYTLLSVTPLFLAAISIAGLVFGARAAESDLVQQVQSLVGSAGAMAIQALLEGSRNTTHGALGTLLGLVTLLFGASGVLIELRDALNTIWEVPSRQVSGSLQTISSFLKERLFSFALVVAIGFLLLVSLVINAGIAAVGAFSASVLPVPEPILHVLNSLFSFVIVTGLFAAIYRVLPDIRIEWRDVVLGSAVTAFLFEIGKALIGLYLGKASFASTYGAAASIVVFIMWVYYSSQIFFLGAEFTKIFAGRYGSQPNAYPEGMVVSSGTRRGGSQPVVAAR